VKNNVYLQRKKIAATVAQLVEQLIRNLARLFIISIKTICCIFVVAVFKITV